MANRDRPAPRHEPARLKSFDDVLGNVDASIAPCALRNDSHLPSEDVDDDTWSTVFRLLLAEAGVAVVDSDDESPDRWEKRHAATLPLSPSCNRCLNRHLGLILRVELEVVVNGRS